MAQLTDSAQPIGIEQALAVLFEPLAATFVALPCTHLLPHLDEGLVTCPPHDLAPDELLQQMKHEHEQRTLESRADRWANDDDLNTLTAMLLIAQYGYVMEEPKDHGRVVEFAGSGSAASSGTGDLTVERGSTEGSGTASGARGAWSEEEEASD